MQIIEGRTAFELEEKSAVAIGKFDGIHRGHLSLLRNITEQKADGLKAVVFTFEPPASVFFRRSGAGEAEEKELSTRQEKRRLFEQLGIDVLVEFPFNKETAAIPAEVFIRDILVGQMKTAYIAAGSDLSFGDKGKGNRELLQAFSREMGYQVRIIDKVIYEKEEISSTFVRRAVAGGKMELARELLGRDYSVTGVVEEGRKLGRRLGMPTLNLYPPEDKLLPPRGVYYSRILCEGQVFDSITNIGRKPTVNDSLTVSVESYLYDFQGDLYGKEIQVRLMSFKRPEQKFADVEALRRQMAQDLEEGRHFHERQRQQRSQESQAAERQFRERGRQQQRESKEGKNLFDRSGTC